MNQFYGLTKLISIATIVFVITGCATPLDSSLNNNGEPQWFASPPQDTEELIYGKGEGIYIESATRNALVHVAEKRRLVPDLGHLLAFHQFALGQRWQPPVRQQY